MYYFFRCFLLNKFLFLFLECEVVFLVAEFRLVIFVGDVVLIIESGGLFEVCVRGFCMLFFYGEIMIRLGFFCVSYFLELALEEV